MIIFSFIGYKKMEHIVLKDEKNLRIMLKSDSQQMDEVVITGMGTKEKKVNLTGKGTDDQASNEEAGDGAGSGKKVIIQKLLMQVDLKKLKDLQGLLEILKEVEDYAEGYGTEEPDGDPDAAPDPA